MPLLPEKLKFTIQRHLQQIVSDQNRLTLIRGAANSFAIKILGAALTLISQALAARLLGATNYGDYVYALTWMNFLVIGGKLGFDMASLRFIATYQSTENWAYLKGFLRYSNRIVKTASFIVTSIFIIVLISLSDQLSNELILVLCISGFAIPFLADLQVHQQRLRAFQKIIQSQFPQEILIPLVLSVSLCALILFPDTQINAATVILLHGLAILAAWILIKFCFNKNVHELLKRQDRLQTDSASWLRTAFHMMLISGFNIVLSQTDILMIGIFLNTSEAGFYSIAAKMAALLVFMLVAFNSILAPIITRLYAQNSMVELQRIITIGANSAFIGSLFIASFLVIFRSQILAVFGSEFVLGGQTILILLTIGQLVNSFAGPADILLSMTGKQGFVTKTLGSSAFGNVMLNLVLIPIYGKNGAAIATILTMFFWNTMMVSFARKELGIFAAARPPRISQ